MIRYSQIRAWEEINMSSCWRNYERWTRNESIMMCKDKNRCNLKNWSTPNMLDHRYLTIRQIPKQKGPSFNVSPTCKYKNKCFSCNYHRKD